MDRTNKEIVATVNRMTVRIRKVITQLEEDGYHRPNESLELLFEIQDILNRL